MLLTLVFSLALVLWNGAAFGAGQPAGANSPEGAARFIGQLSTAVSATLSDSGLDDTRRVQALRGLLVQGLDTDTIGRVVLGRYWRGATAAQRQEYQRLFQAFILTNYATRLAKYPSASVAITSARPGKRNLVIVGSLMKRPAKPPVRVDWLVAHTAQGHRVIDVLIEGISMAITRRAEFAAIIKRNGGNLEGLLATLRLKTT